MAASAWTLAACQAPPTARPAMALGRVPAVLTAPNGVDWTSQRISSPAILRGRQALHRRLEAFTSPAGWSANGVTLSSLGAGTNDYASNGPAAVYNQSAAPAVIQSKTFFLTHGGLFVRVAAGSNPTQAANRAVLNLGKTFTRSFVSLSPSCTRAYLLSDDGTFFIVNTLDMATIYKQTSLGSGLNCAGLAPMLDPVTCNSDDSREEIYVPTSDGKMHRFLITCGAIGTAPTVSADTPYTVATNAPAVKLSAPPMVFNRRIFAADTSGNVTDFDVASNSVLGSYALGSVAVSATPSLDMDDNGNPTALFVSIGSTCAWIDLASAQVYFSRPLFLDDSDTGKPTRDYLLNYNYANGLKVYYLSLQDAVTMNLMAPQTNLVGFSSYKETVDITPSDAYTDGNASHGPSAAFMRFSNADNNIPAGSIFQDVKLLMQPNASLRCPPPVALDASPYLAGSSTLWTSSSITYANHPALGVVVGRYIGSLVGGSSHANATYNGGAYSTWDVTSAFGSSPVADYGLAVENQSGGFAAFPYAPGQSPSNSNSSGVHAAPEFKRGSLTGTNQYPGAYTSTTSYPSGATGAMLQFLVSSSQRTLPSIQTTPIIDSLRKVVYVFDTNALYVLDYSSPVRFEDADVSAQDGSQTPHTVFCTTRMGNRNNGASYGSTYVGASSQRFFVSDLTTPLMGWDGNEIYALDRYPTAFSGGAPTTYTYALSKIAISNFNAGAATPSNFTSPANYQEFTNVTAAETPPSGMLMDAFSGLDTGPGDHVNFALPGSSTSASGSVFIDLP